MLGTCGKICPSVGRAECVSHRGTRLSSSPVKSQLVSPGHQERRLSKLLLCSWPPAQPYNVQKWQVPWTRELGCTQLAMAEGESSGVPDLLETFPDERIPEQVGFADHHEHRSPQ